MNNENNEYYINYVDDYTVDKNVYMNTITVYSNDFNINACYVIMPDVLTDDYNVNNTNHYRFESFLNENDNNMNMLCNTVNNILIDYYQEYIVNMNDIDILENIRQIKQSCENTLMTELREQYGIKLYNFVININSEIY
jgi:hypothetical protein